MISVEETRFQPQRQRQGTPAEALRPSSSDAWAVPVFCGPCAGAPRLEVAAALCGPDELRAFWRGYTVVAVICALLLVVELAMLPSPRTVAPLAAKAAMAATAIDHSL